MRKGGGGRKQEEQLPQRGQEEVQRLRPAAPLATWVVWCRSAPLPAHRHSCQHITRKAAHATKRFFPLRWREEEEEEEEGGV